MWVETQRRDPARLTRCKPQSNTWGEPSPQENPASLQDRVASLSFTFQGDSEHDVGQLWAPQWFFMGAASAFGVLAGE